MGRKPKLNKQETAVIFIRCDPDVAKKLKQLADADERSVSSYASRVLKQHVEDSMRRN